MSFKKVELAGKGDMSKKWENDLSSFNGVKGYVEKATRGTNKIGVSAHSVSGCMGKGSKSKY